MLHANSDPSALVSVRYTSRDPPNALKVNANSNDLNDPPPSLPSPACISQMSSYVSARSLAHCNPQDKLDNLPLLQIGHLSLRRHTSGRASRSTHIPSPLGTGYRETLVPMGGL